MSAAPDQQELILNAAKTCYLRLGVAKTTAADIAAEAGISRATLYRRFPSHDDIFISVLARDSLEMVRDCNARMSGITDPGERIIESMLFSLDEIPRRPLHSHLFKEGSDWLSQAMPAEKLHGISLGMLTDLLGLPNEEPGNRAIDDLAEWLLRVLTSYAMVPSQRARNRDEMRTFLHTMLDPTINAILGSRASPIKPKNKGRKPHESTAGHH